MALTAVGGCIPARNVPIDVGIGVIDFDSKTIEIVESTHRCQPQKSDCDRGLDAAGASLSLAVQQGLWRRPERLK